MDREARSSGKVAPMAAVLTSALFVLAATASACTIAHSLAVHGRKALGLRQQLKACGTTQELRFTITEFRNAPAPAQVIRPKFRPRGIVGRSVPLRAAA